MAKASTVIKQAQLWIGLKESNGSHKKIIDIYNTISPLPRKYKAKYTDSWCAIFISAVAKECNALDIIPAECSCEKMIALFKDINCWQEDESITPRVGDIIFYDWEDNGIGDNKGWSDHVGIVESVTNGLITVIEGNKSDSVSRRTIAVNAKTIRGYARPKYDKEQTGTTLKYNVGAIVNINGVYNSSTSSIKLNPYKNTGTITKIYEGTRNPYLLNNGDIGFVNDDCIVGSDTITPSTPSTSYYKPYTGKSIRIDEVFSAIGVPSQYRGDWKKRKTVAVKNGISNYTGTGSQNDTLVCYAKQGKLKKV